MHFLLQSKSIMGKIHLFPFSCALACFRTFSRILFGLVLSLNKFECLNCKVMLLTTVAALFTLKLPVWFIDFPYMQGLKCSSFNKNRTGLEDYCHCAYQCVTVPRIFYYIKDESFSIYRVRTINRLNV